MDRPLIRRHEGRDGTPPLRALALDTRTGRTGEVMERLGGSYFLRPPGGGKEWEVPVRLVQLLDAPAPDACCAPDAGATARESTAATL